MRNKRGYWRGDFYLVCAHTVAILFYWGSHMHFAKTDILTSGAGVLLDVLFLDHPYAIHHINDEWIGELHSIRWDEIRHIAVAVASLSATITSRPESEFQLAPFLSAKQEKSLVGIKVLHRSANALRESDFEIRSAVIQHYLETIATRGVDRNYQLPFSDELTPEHISLVENTSANILEKLGGRKCHIPIKAEIGGKQLSTLSINGFAPRPYSTQSDMTKTIEGILEGLDRNDRDCKIILTSGQALSIKFNVEMHLQEFKSALCDNKPYSFVIADVLDAKGRAGRIVTDIRPAKHDAEDFKLQMPLHHKVRSSTSPGNRKKNK